MHIDTFIDDFYCQHKYARWMFNYFRLPAVLKADFEEFMKEHKLFCTWHEQRYRVTGASRLGDVWLHSDPKRDCGYEHRVDVE